MTVLQESSIRRTCRERECVLCCECGQGLDPGAVGKLISGAKGTDGKPCPSTTLQGLIYVQYQREKAGVKFYFSKLSHHPLAQLPILSTAYYYRE